MLRLVVWSILFVGTLHAQDVLPPAQPKSGLGSTELYRHDSVRMTDLAQTPEGYWLFEPAYPAVDSAPVLVFLHGYGAYNPMIYGAWIRHMVRQGWIVIYPRYQKDLLRPRPPLFSVNAAKGIRDALIFLEETPGRTKPIKEKLLMAGHSYGGATAAVLVADTARFGIPLPKALLMAQPGTGKLKTGKLDSYDVLPDSLPIVLIGSADDYTVGVVMCQEMLKTGHGKVPRHFLYQVKDNHGDLSLTASHLEPYAFDLAFDNGVRNYTARRCLSRSKLDAIDWYIYWASLDELARHVLNGTKPDTDFQYCLPVSSWSDGCPMQTTLFINTF